MRQKYKNSAVSTNKFSPFWMYKQKDKLNYILHNKYNYNFPQILID